MGEARRKRLRRVQTLEAMDVPRRGNLRLSVADLGGPVLRAAIPLADLERLAAEAGAVELPSGVTIDHEGATLDGWRSIRNAVFDGTWSDDRDGLDVAVRLAVWCLFHGVWGDRVRATHRRAVAETGTMVAILYRDRNTDDTTLLVDAEERDDNEALRALADRSMNAIERQRRAEGVN